MTFVQDTLPPTHDNFTREILDSELTPQEIRNILKNSPYYREFRALRAKATGDDANDLVVADLLQEYSAYEASATFGVAPESPEAFRDFLDTLYGFDELYPED